MDSELWKSNVFDTIREIASEQFQRDAWLNKGEEVSSPNEVFCQLSDDLYEEFLRSPDVSLSIEQRTIGEKLSQMLKQYAQSTDEFLDPKIVIDDPRWVEIRKVAKKFLEA